MHFRSCGTFGTCRPTRGRSALRGKAEVGVGQLDFRVWHKCEVARGRARRSAANAQQSRGAQSALTASQTTTENYPVRQIAAPHALFLPALSSPFRRNISVFQKLKPDYMSSHPVPHRGALRTSRTRGGMRWTRQRRARKGSQGGMNPVSDCRRADGRRCQLSSPELAGWYEVRRDLWRDGRGRRNRVVPTPPGWRQVVWRCIRLNRAAMHRQSARRRWQ